MLRVANCNTILSNVVTNLTDLPGVIRDPAEVLLTLATQIGRSLQNSMNKFKRDRLTVEDIMDIKT